MHRIEAMPPRSRKKDLCPSVQVTVSINALGVGLITTDEPGGNTEAAASRHEKHGKIAASSLASGERVGGRLGGAFRPDLAVGPGEQRLVEALEEARDLPAAFGRQSGGEGPDAFVLVLGRQVVRHRAASAGRPGQRRQLETGGRPVGVSFQIEAALDAQMAGEALELQLGEGIAVAVHQILPHARQGIDSQAEHLKNGAVRARREPKDMRRESHWRRITVMCFVTNREAHLLPSGWR